jgi:hypothetical protein
MSGPGKPLPDAVAASLVGVLASLDGTTSDVAERMGDSADAAALAVRAELSELAGFPIPMRRRLCDRRACWTYEFEHAGIRYVAGVGRFENDPGADLAEVFFNVPGKAGTTIESHARDEAIAASLALQFGCPVDVLRRALTRNVDGSPSGALGRLLESLDRERGAQ